LPGVRDPIRELNEELTRTCGRRELAAAAFELVTRAGFTVDEAVTEVLNFEALYINVGLNGALRLLDERVSEIVEAAQRDEEGQMVK